MTCWLQESLMMYWNERGDLLSIDARELAEFRQWRELKWRAPSLNELIKEFLKSKREDRNLHSGYVKTLEYNLSPFCDAIGNENLAQIESVTPFEILSGLNKNPRTRNNVRDALCSAFRFARDRGYLPEGITAAEKLKRIKLDRCCEISILLARADARNSGCVPASIHSWLSDQRVCWNSIRRDSAKAVLA